MAATLVQVPDFLRNWQWERALNPLYEEVKTDSLAWLHGFGFFDVKSQDSFDRCEFQHARSTCDLMDLFYVIDEYTDVEDAGGVQKIVDIIMDAFRNPSKPRPTGEFRIGEMARQFWALAIQTASPMSQVHFVDTMQEYLDSITEQAVDRANNRVRTIDEYWALRRLTGGCLPSFALIELGLEFPEEIYRHPLLENLRECANRAICAANDVYSYNIERVRGHALHNLVTIVMHEKDMGPQDAITWIGAWHDDLVADFFASKAELEQLLSNGEWASGDVERQVRIYVDGLGCWVRGSDDWHLEGQRHLGNQGPSFRKNRQLLMLPRVDAMQARAGVTDAEGILVRELMEKNAVAGMHISTQATAILTV
ncbi:terpenoid synthase [Lasiosphaeria ovina]|uniref:Terpene synthase n=1 Tax=Lasiosphaeria ovina TaxID=92902 RepID=A0AAE0K0J0_9PEZI|nr:terpenoid synthase [Lasiosphaeria ovina]